MKTPVLIGIHGVKRSGKGTVAQFIADWAGALSLSAADRGFADAVKWIFARQFMPEITREEAVEWCDKYKDDSYAQFDGTTVSDNHPHVVNQFMDAVPFRTALAQFASEGGRDILGEDIWLNTLLPAASGWSTGPWDDADICTISDVRFPNEYRRVKDFGGLLIKVRRLVAEEAVIAEAQKQGRQVHRSELGIDDKHFDYVINNEGTLDQLQATISLTMEEYAWRKR